MPTETQSTGIHQVSKEEIVFAATNDPSLATRHFKLGDREFPVLNLGYDPYVLFMAQLQPLMGALVGSLPGAAQLGLGGGLTPGALLTYCGSSLPIMVRIMCNQSDPTVTVEDVKRMGGNPFTLASAALLQIEQNHMINDIRSFFVQVVPLLMTKKR